MSHSNSSIVFPHLAYIRVPWCLSIFIRWIYSDSDFEAPEFDKFWWVIRSSHLYTLTNSTESIHRVCSQFLILASFPGQGSCLAKKCSQSSTEQARVLWKGPKRWQRVRDHDKPRLMGVASHRSFPFGFCHDWMVFVEYLWVMRLWIFVMKACLGVESCMFVRCPFRNSEYHF